MGGEVNLSRICGDMEERLIQRYANTIDPGIKVKPLKVPGIEHRSDPKSAIGMADSVTTNDRHEPVCRWELRL